MGSKEKIGFLSNLNKNIKKSIKSKILTYSLVGTLTFGASPNLLKKEDAEKDKTNPLKIGECFKKTYRQWGYTNMGLDTATNNDGDLYTIGYYNAQDNYYQFILLKYSKDGNLMGEYPIWKEKENKIDILEDKTKIAIDSKDNIYISSEIKNKDSDIRLIKLSKDGKKIWETIYNSGDEENGSLIIDKNNNVYIAGASYKEDAGWNHLLLKYGQNGKKIWGKQYNYGAYGKIESIVLDEMDNIISTGYKNEIGLSNPHLTIAKYDNNGMNIWYKEHGSNIGYDLTINNNNIYVIGGSFGQVGNGVDTNVLLKYDKDGNLIWEKVNTTDSKPSNIALIDKNIYILNSSNLFLYDSNGNKIENIKLSIFGTEMILAENNLYITGGTYNGFHPDLALIKLCNINNDPSEVASCQNKCEEAKNECNKGCNLDSFDFNNCDNSVNIFMNEMADCLISCTISCSKEGNICKEECGPNVLETVDDRYEGIKAKVMIEEFADFECPYSKEVQTSLNQIKKEYVKEDLQITYKHFPLPSHSFAQKAAEASECARDQGKFWEYHDKLFENQNSLDINSLKQYASDLELNINQFNECLDLSIKKGVIEKDIEEAKNKGVKGAPTFFINDTTLVGAQNIEEFFNAIDNYFPSKKPTMLWTKTYDNSKDEYGEDLVIDNSGDLYIAGNIDNGLNKDDDGIIIKYDGNGDLIWEKIFNSGFDDSFEQITIDHLGFLYIAGNVSSEDQKDKILTIKYNNKGDMLWNKSFEVETVYEDIKLIPDDAGNIYVGADIGGSSQDCILLKYDRDGKLEWNKLYDGGFTDEIRGIEVDKDQNVILVSMSYTSKEYNFDNPAKNMAIKFNKGGDLLESKVLESLPEYMLYEVIDSSKFNYSFRTYYNGKDDDIIMLKYKDDLKIWEKIFDGGYKDNPENIKIDNSGNIYVIGWSLNEKEEADIRIIKYKQPSEVEPKCDDKCDLERSNCEDNNSYIECELELDNCHSKCSDENEEE